MRKGQFVFFVLAVMLTLGFVVSVVHAGTVDVIFHKPEGVNISNVRIDLIGAPGSTAYSGSTSQSATWTIKDVYVPSTRLFRFEWIRNHQQATQVLYAWIKLDGSFSDVDVDIPAHNVTFVGDGYPSVNIGAIPARMAEQSLLSSRLNENYDEVKKVAFVGASGQATVPMLDGCYSIYAVPYSQNTPRIYLEFPVCVGGEPGYVQVVPFVAP